MRARGLAHPLKLVFAAGVMVGCTDVPDDSSQQSAVTMGEDLVISAVGDPPAAASLGTSFTVTDTTTNSGTFDAGTSLTRYFLSLNGTQAAPGTFRLGERMIAPLAMGGASDSGTATATIRAGTPAGTYFLLACADHTKAVEETNENNNCRASTGQVVVSGADLIEQDVSISPTSIDANAGTLTITETVVNNGADAVASVTRYYLSTDMVKDGNDAYIRNCVNGGPIPGRDVPAIAAGGSSSGFSSTSPLCVRDSTGLHAPATGTYYVLACADETQVVAETNEQNQCAASAQQLTVTLCGNNVIEGAETCDDGNAVGGDGCSATCTIEDDADLVATAVSDPPMTTDLGATFSVTDTVQNVSSNGATATTTVRYFLSIDTTHSGGDIPLGGGRSVPPLNAGVSNSGTTTVTVPTAGVAAGSYYLIACADGDNVLVESDEANNCIASAAQTSIGGADLIVSAVDNPPTAAAVGSSFTVGDTTSNIGDVSVIATRTKYYLSANGINAAAGTFMLAARDVPALGPGQSSTGTTTATIRSGTAPGTYFLLACADRGPNLGPSSQVGETNENNNCRVSTGTVVVQ